MKNNRNLYASSRDMTGTTHETSVTLLKDPNREAISEKKLMDQKNAVLETIAEIDQLIHCGAYTINQTKRMIRKKTILFGKIALFEYGLSA